jgi:hypothetical protein
MSEPEDWLRIVFEYDLESVAKAAQIQQIVGQVCNDQGNPEGFRVIGGLVYPENRVTPLMVIYFLPVAASSCRSEPKLAKFSPASCVDPNINPSNFVRLA